MDPTTQPAPITPTTPVPGVPETPQPGGTVMSQDQMRTNLKELMSKIDSKFQDFNSQKFSTVIILRTLITTLKYKICW